MLRNMGNGAAVADVFGDGRLTSSCSASWATRTACSATSSRPPAQRCSSTSPRPPGSRTTAAAAPRPSPISTTTATWTSSSSTTSTATEVGSPSSIYRNDGDGTFDDVTEASGFDPVGYLVGGLSLADYNHDGLLDVYVTYWTMELGGDPGREQMAIKGRFPGQNRLYENLGGFRFQDVTDDVHLGQVTADSFTSIFADFTGDGWADLYVAVDHREDLFFENTGGASAWRRRSTGVGHVGNDMGIAVADLGSDGTLDLYVTNITDPNDQFGTDPGNTLLVGERGGDGRVTYADEAAAMGVEDSGWGWGTAFTDMNLDGRLDLFAVQGMEEFIAEQSPELRNQKARLFLGDADGDVRRSPPATGCDIPGDQRSVVPLDYDRDGAPDLLVTQIGLFGRAARERDDRSATG